MLKTKDSFKSAVCDIRYMGKRCPFLNDDGFILSNEKNSDHI